MPQTKPQMTDEERQSMLDDWEHVIEKSFIQIGFALRTIKTNRYYLAVCDDWQTYLKTRWHMSESKFKRMSIDAQTARDINAIIKTWIDDDFDMPLVNKQSHAQALKKYGVDSRAFIYSYAHHEAHRQDTKVTAKLIEECGDILEHAKNHGVVSVDGIDTPALAIAVTETLDEMRQRQKAHINDGYLFTRIETVADERGKIIIDAPECANKPVIVTLKYETMVSA